MFLPSAQNSSPISYLPSHPSRFFTHGTIYNFGIYSREWIPVFGDQVVGDCCTSSPSANIRMRNTHRPFFNICRMFCRVSSVGHLLRSTIRTTRFHRKALRNGCTGFTTASTENYGGKTYFTQRTLLGKRFVHAMKRFFARRVPLAK